MGEKKRLRTAKWRMEQLHIERVRRFKEQIKRGSEEDKKGSGLVSPDTTSETDPEKKQ